MNKLFLLLISMSLSLVAMESGKEFILKDKSDSLEKNITHTIFTPPPQPDSPLLSLPGPIKLHIATHVLLSAPTIKNCFNFSLTCKESLALYKAALNEDCVLEHFKHIIHRKRDTFPLFKETHFFTAIRLGAKTAVEKAILNDPDILNKKVTRTDLLGYVTYLTPLMYAAQYNSGNIIKLLLKNGVSVHERNWWYRITPLHHATSNKAQDAIKLLIEKKANINAQDWQGQTPLHYATTDNSFEMVQLLLSLGADATIRRSLPWLTPLALDMAYEQKNTEMIFLLRDAEKKSTK